MSNEVSQDFSSLPKTASALLSKGLLSARIKETFRSASDPLQLVEKRIASRLPSDARQLTEISQYLQQLGGKRVRPLLSILSARLFGQTQPSTQLIDVAAGIELIHMATLLHDDIIDKSSKRRSKPSAFHVYGLTPTLLTGDFLLVRAFGLCAHLDTFIIDACEQACVALTEGELMEGKLSLDRRLSLAEYETIVDKKTASLFHLAGSVGAHLAGAKEEHIATTARFGTKAGIAFQMIDDVLDIVADEDLLGKPAGADLRQQTPSLINILWLDSEDSFAQDFFSQACEKESLVQEAMARIKASEIVAQARSIAQEYARSALAELDALPEETVDGTTKQQMCSLVEYTLDRCM